MPMPVASTTRSPMASTRRPTPSAEASRMKANADSTAPTSARPTPKWCANSGMTGATMPNPTATLNATAASTATSFGRSPNTFARHRCIRVTLPVAAPARAQVVADDVVAELVIGRREHPAAVAFGKLLDEVDQTLVLSQHEDVERRAAPGHLVGFGKRDGQRLWGRRPVEGVVAARQQVRSRLAVGHHEYDRFVLRVPVEEPPGNQQRVLKVRALHHL